MVMPERRGAFLGRSVVAVAVACAVLSSAVACSSSGHPKPSKSIDTLAAAIAAELKSHTIDDNIRAIIVQVDGRTRFEHYYSSSADRSRSSFSVTKSVMSTLVGIAIDEGRLHLDDRLNEMLPREAAAMTPQVARVTLRQLLTMTGGFPDTWNATGAADPLDSAPNWTRFILAHQDRAPGVQFHYSDYGVDLLSPILVQATGQSVLTYARAKLFDPLGISTRPADQPRADQAHVPEYMRAQFAWPVDPQGFNLGAGLIKLRPRDMAKFGQLFLQAGRWHDRQVVSARWVRQATIAQAGKAFPSEGYGPLGSQNYGYLWWLEKVDGTDAYFALGFGGQRIEVVPAQHLVIVISTDVDLTNPYAATASPEDTQRLVTIIAPLAH